MSGWLVVLLWWERREKAQYVQAEVGHKENDEMVFPGSPTTIVLNCLEGPYQHG